ncbi:MAG: transcription termination factor NusA [Oscillospiraceae bacterium]|jgi:N utilization substance protein A|nr:transcription termination factor NusA [Oscillospiraceae bacterium]
MPNFGFSKANLACDKMNKKDFFMALRAISEEKGMDISHLVEKIKNAMLIVARKEYNAIQNVFVEIDEKAEKFEIEIEKTVSDELLDPASEISLADARKISKHAKVGDLVRIKLDTKKVGRIAAQGAKQVIKQGIREIERDKVFFELKKKEGQILTASVYQVTDPAKGFVTIDIDGISVVLPKSEQLPGQTLSEGDTIKVYVSEVLSADKGPKIMISRTGTDFIEKLFELEIPEIADSTVEIVAVAREAGLRTKVAVASNNENVDPVGTCIGQRGMRINRIVNELGSEKLDVVRYEKEPRDFIKSALLPATVIEVKIIDEEAEECEVIVPDDQISLAIGHKGQNVRLVAKLTGYKINVRTKDDQLTGKVEDAEETGIQG